MNKPSQFGKYLLLERINVGGMAEVFKAKAFGIEGFERILAIKRILPNMAEDEEFINMFIDEARIAVQLSHANVVPVYELGKLESQYYIAMEYVAGKDLRQLLDKLRKSDVQLPLSAAAYIASKICDGLDYAHHKTDASGKPLNLIHRDVSPQNILLGYDGAVKVTDFGIAKAEDRASKTQAGVLKGKFAYMSPEQVRGLEIDLRSDIFAVGILLYEMVTAKRLFIGESDFATLEKVRAAEVEPPRNLRPDLSPEFEAVMLKALARERDDRFATAADLGQELLSFVRENNQVYTSQRLRTLLHEEYADNIAQERARMESYSKEIKIAANDEQAVQSHMAAPTGDWGIEGRGEKTMIFESDFGTGDMALPEPETLLESGGPRPPSERPTAAFDKDQAQSALAMLADEKSKVRWAPPWRLLGTLMLGLMGLGGLLVYSMMPPSAGPGSLVVTATPISDVNLYLDGVLVAQHTPVTQENVPTGEHRLVARANGYKDKAYRFELAPGAPAEIRVELERDETPAMPGEATIDLTSEPDMATVRVGGLPQGVTPLTLHTSDTSQPLIMALSKPGYASQTLVINFSPGERIKPVRVKLVPLGQASGAEQPQAVAPSASAPVQMGQAHLVVRSRPERAKVFVGGVQRGFTPIDIGGLDPSASYSVEVLRDGFRPFETQVQMANRGLVVVKAQLVSMRQTGGGRPPASGGQRMRTTLQDTSGEDTGCGGMGGKISVMALDVSDCHVTVGRQALGVAPMFKKNCPAGRCAIEVQCPGGKHFSTTRQLKVGFEEKIIIKPDDWK